MKSVISVLPYFKYERLKEFQAILGSIKGTTGGGFTCYCLKKRALSSVQYPIEFFNSLIM